jgi:hypothetical protein
LENLILVATLGGPPMFARIGVMMGLKQNVEQTLNSSRKDPHSGKRKLARDQTTGQVSWLHPDNITANGADYFGNSSVCGAFIDTRDLRAGFFTAILCQRPTTAHCAAQIFKADGVSLIVRK